MDPAHARARLEEERQRLLDLRKSHHVEHLEEPLLDAQGELSSADQHPGDEANETHERAKDASILEQIEADLVEIDAAYERLDEGRYGVCEGTGEVIPDDRLEVAPAARYTVKYQQELENRDTAG